jgi:hypothetical protein
MNLHRAGRPLVAVALTLALCACKSSPFGKAEVDSADQVPQAVEQARAERAAGRPTKAMDLLRAARDVDDLPTGDRIQVETLLEQIALERIEELADDPAGTRELEAMLDLGLPSQIAVHAGITAARQLLSSGRPKKAYKLLVSLETKFPTHTAGRQAGEICVEAGLRMAGEPKRFLGFFTLRDEGLEALEWVVVTYPSEPRCDEAYFELAERYADDNEFELAVQRYEELISYHYKSPLSVEAQARVPRMRLAGLESPEYDRRQLQDARRELEAWLENRTGSPGEEQVRRDYGDCLRRLVLSDQGIARFYTRIGKPFGALLHAQRALDTAQLTGDQRLVTDCTTLLAQVRELEDKVARDGEFKGFLDQPEADVKPTEALETPPSREGEGSGT